MESTATGVPSANWQLDQGCGIPFRWRQAATGRPPPPTRAHARPARLEERIIVIFISNERAMIIVSYRTSINY